ncbi:MAG: CheR family methyltransferase [Paracoccaceae bacterium]|jgi:two-component system CheB/CheR fusion protein|nr:CheR family methyltransferase [Paracoccaceae bacterium]
MGTIPALAEGGRDAKGRQRGIMTLADGDDAGQSQPLTVCAVGASAGGMEALRALFGHVRPDLGLAYIVVVHLAPDHPSALGEILGTATAMPVEVVDDTAVLKPDHVYVISPDRELTVLSGAVTARPFEEARGHRLPIDHLFESVAALPEAGVGIVLSGGGSDGAAGARALREAGGVVLVQDPEEAALSGMPDAASAVADVVAPIRSLAERLADIAAAPRLGRTSPGEETGQAVKAILRILHRRLGHDFSRYKRATILRRIARRMQLTRQESLPAYAAFLQASDEEQHALFADFLISVTAFFRDPQVFEALALAAIKPMFDRLDDRSKPQVRVWSVGCATGEEAYSLAILLLEEAERRAVHPAIQIFATDIDEAALARAREGVYGREIETKVSSSRLHRFFVEHDGVWRVRQELRDLVLFTNHSVIKDPPFIHLDLVCCRNLLIYLDRDLQQHVLGMLNYALDPGGFLVLGTTETVDSAPRMFRQVNREMRIFAAEASAERSVANLQLPAQHDTGGATPGGPMAPRPERDLGAMHLAALESAAPPSILVGSNRIALHLSPAAGRFLAPAGGEASLELTNLVRPELRLDLGFALHRALEDGEATFTAPVAVALDGARRRVAMHVAPDRSADKGAARAIVMFLEGGKVPDEPPSGGTALTADMRRMVQELGEVRDRLAQSQVENTVTMQELRAANEELQSMNEEYRSTSEELETSKEELQSMNEELQTLNDELKSRLESVSAAHSDLRNLVDATDYATLFLDPELRIRLFTPPVKALFKLADGDVGRPITDFASSLDTAELAERAHDVLRDLAPIEVETEGDDGRWYTLRVRPYRTIDNRIDGVVVTFSDVTDARAVAESTRQSEERFATFLRATTDAAFRVSADWSDMWLLQSGSLPADTGGPRKDWLEAYVPQEDHQRVQEAVATAIAGNTLFELEHRVFRSDGTIGWVVSRAAPILDEDGSVREWFGIGTDVSARKCAEAAQALAAELDHRVHGTLEQVLAIAEETQRESPSLEAFAKAFEGRLQALAAAHEALTRTCWDGANLAALVESAAETVPAPQGGRIAISGPPVILGPNAATSLRLALHELCTNALSYGALSVPEGEVTVAWWFEGGVSGEERLILEWREAGGPPVAPSAHTRFGARHLKEELPSDLDGTAQLSLEPSGLVYRLCAPVSRDLHHG